MKRKVYFLIGLLVLAAIIIAIIKFMNGRSPKEGELRVESSPVASVFIDNKHVGRTPFREKVAIGQYTVKVVPETTVESLVPWQGKVSVGPNLLTYINTALADSELSTAVDILWLERNSSKKPIVSVTTNPDSATVLIDDATRGVSPLELSDVTSGDHTLTITSPGFLPRTIKIKATPGYKLIATFKLALSAGGDASTSATPTTDEVGTITPTPSKKMTPTPSKIASSSAEQPDPVKPFITIKETPTGYLRVRMEPSTAATESARVNPGEKYHIEDEQTGWYKIIYDNSNTGWVSGQYAQKSE